MTDSNNTNLLFDEWHKARMGNIETLDRALMFAKGRDAKSVEYIKHGFSRRVVVMGECLDGFFEMRPPDDPIVSDDFPTKRLNVYLHAFLVNTAGSIDNLSWIHALETDVDKVWDLEKRKMDVNIFKPAYREHLCIVSGQLVDQFADWYNFLIDHRHPTAHRIPPYVVPYTNTDANDPEETRDHTPRYIHSFSSKYGPIPLHAQAIVDIITIHKLAGMMFDEIENKLPNKAFEDKRST